MRVRAANRWGISAATRAAPARTFKIVDDATQGTLAVESDIRFTHECITNLRRQNMPKTWSKSTLNESAYKNETASTTGGIRTSLMAGGQAGRISYSETSRLEGGYLTKQRLRGRRSHVDLNTVHFLSGPIACGRRPARRFAGRGLLDIRTLPDYCGASTASLQEKRRGLHHRPLPLAQKSIWDISGCSHASPATSPPTSVRRPHPPRA